MILICTQARAQCIIDFIWPNYLFFYIIRETSQSSILGKRKRKNRWDEKSEEESMKSSPGVTTAPVSTLSVSAPASSSAASSAPSGPLDIMAEFQRAKALVQQRAAEAKSGLLSQDKERQRQLEEQREVKSYMMEMFLL